MLFAIVQTERNVVITHLVIHYGWELGNYNRCTETGERKGGGPKTNGGQERTVELRLRNNVTVERALKCVSCFL